jgi:sigma-E factor negative regulatory protein RseB
VFGVGGVHFRDGSRVVSCRSFLASVLLLGGWASADALEFSEDKAMRWLSEMNSAVSDLNYKGIVTYLRDQQVESFQLFHASRKSGVERERLVSMNSPLREVVRTAEKVICYFPETKKASVERMPVGRSALFELPDDLTRLSRHYSVKLQGQEYVARRLSQVVSIEPRDDYRYARLMWLDVESKLPLKVEMLDENGQAAEQMVFTSVSINAAIPPEDFEPTVQATNFTWTASQRQSLPLASLRWALHDVPEGFQILSYTRLKRPSADHEAEHILLGDGFSSVSVYVEDLKLGQGKDYPKKIGNINAFNTKISGNRITVMGEVPAKTVRAIAEGLRLREKLAE